MILYGIEALRNAGIKHIIISLIKPYGFMELLKDGDDYGVHISYVYQHGVEGITWAINEARPWIGEEPFVVYLGDNIFLDGITPHVKAFMEDPSKPLILLKEVPTIEDARRYGVAKLDHSNITEFIEKPQIPPSCYIVLGLYCLTPKFFEVTRELSPSARGEYEITDALNLLLPVNHRVYEGKWWDCGTFDDISEASKHLRG